MLLRLLSLVLLFAIAAISLFPEMLDVFPAGWVASVSEHPILSLLAAATLIALIARGAGRR